MNTRPRGWNKTGAKRQAMIGEGGEGKRLFVVCPLGRGQKLLDAYYTCTLENWAF